MKYWIFIIAFIAQTQFINAQLVNGDFENINTNGSGFQSPENWNFGYFTDSYGSEITNDSYSGNYAVKLWSWYFVQSNVEFHYGEAYNLGDNISNRPISLKGFYKFENPNIQFNVPDSAFVQISLTKYNNVTNERDTIAFSQKNLGEQYSYSEFEVVFNYLNTQIPDSIQINFRTSYFQGPSDNTDENNFLYLDNLSLENNTMSVAEKTYKNPIIYPNPTNSNIKINSEKPILKINIYSASGKLLRTETKTQNGLLVSCDLSKLSTGIYFLEIIGMNESVLDKVKVVKK